VLESYLALIRHNLEQSVSWRVYVCSTLVIAEDLAKNCWPPPKYRWRRAGVLLSPASVVTTLRRPPVYSGGTVHWVPDDAYQRRQQRGALIASTGYVPALAAAECLLLRNRSWLHTHPGTAPPEPESPRRAP